MSNPIRLGLIGLGRAGNGMQREELRGREDKFVFKAVCDCIEERTKSYAAEYGSRTYTKIEDFLKDPEVELVSIATRSNYHYEHAKMALLAGKSVFLEKPFCMRTAEAKELIDLGSQPGGPRLFIRHNRRFESGFETAMKIIESGKLGEVYEIRLARHDFRRRHDWQTISEYGGGHLLNWGPHIIDHALQFCGGDYTELYSSLRHVVAAGDCEDHVKLVFTGINGRTVDMEISFGIAIPAPEYMIYGTRGALISGENRFHLRYLDPTVPLTKVTANPATHGTYPDEDVDKELRWIEEDVSFGDGTDRIWDALYNTIRLGKPYPIPLHQAAKIVEVIEAAKKGTIFEQ